MYDKQMKQMAISSVVFFIIAMSIMLYTACNKSVDKKEGLIINQEIESTGEKDAKELSVVQDGSEQGYLCIPLSADVTEENVILQADYVEQKLYITLDGLEENFYEYNKISGNSSYLNKILYTYYKGKTKLQIQMSGLYEHNVYCKNDTLYLEFYSPREQYDKIIVVDANNSSGTVPLIVVKKLKEKLDQTDIKVYYTRLDTSNPSNEKRVLLANQSRADMFISVRVNVEEDDTKKRAVQTIYNGNFFIPSFGSVDLADIMERNVCKVTRSLARGLIEADASNLLVNNATVPVAVIDAGYVSSKQEKDRLGNDGYIEKLSEGIYRGIMDAYRVLETQD